MNLTTWWCLCKLSKVDLVIIFVL